MNWVRPSDTILLFIFTYTLIAYLSMYMHYSYLAIKLYIPLRYYFLYWEPVMIKVIYETFILAVIYRSLHSHNLWVTLIANINTLKCDCNSRCFFFSETKFHSCMWSYHKVWDNVAVYRKPCVYTCCVI